MTVSRRDFLLWGTAGSTALALGSAWSQAPANLGTAALPAQGWRQFSLGSAEVFALNDGVVRRPLGEEFVRNAPLEQVKAVLASQQLPTEYIDVPYNSFLMVVGGKRWLIDAGFADNGPANTGRLLENLRGAGFGAADIDVVLLSHLHGDHVSGLRRKDGSLVFPNATVLVPTPEYDFWMDPKRLEAAPPGARPGFVNARRVLDNYPADKLQRFTPGDRLLGAVDSIAAFGHSPGHTLFTLRGTQSQFTYLADAAHYPALFTRNPDWQVQFDMDAEAARASRRAALARAAADQGIVGGYHFPFPAFGRIKPEGNGYAFQTM
ncbi:MAG: MBL fold metallo-hydrolase [Hydrogenophaga sp.]|jgi:glyoxylase-like metal-dependent hydrolase (beta-lactamase superfamily II)|uniref:MBL fold metallo-hydrolase n=1 Tax=Hydrogenophaga sp. TaxID=1904254 RepID=UPI001DACC2A6|nr:MBL fold metallo-hydrolase [Hydrogenophaga sp.]MBW0172342.1 MBL fold metallo-hydrolase [Hydrogenophaga sp.]MBW0182713.1 MBL fold metallo-hydrolase [Hydrogenophaga sp.]